MIDQERRHRLRFGLQLSGAFVLLKNSRPLVVPVISKNICSGGCYLVGEIEPEVGDRGRVELNWHPEEDLSPVLRVQAQALRVDHLRYETFGLALAFETAPALEAPRNRSWRSDNRLGTPPLLVCDEINHAVFEYYPRLQRIKQFVEENYTEPISLGTTAQIAAMERTYFCTFFHQKVGISFGEWLRRTRIAKAIMLMSESDYSITEIACSVGFGDLRTFERAFKRYTQMTPLQFKKSLRPMATMLAGVGR